MRQLAPLCIAMLGVLSTMPAQTEAGFPGSGQAHGGSPYHAQDGSVQATGAAVAGHVHDSDAPQYSHDARCMCPDCQVKRAIEKAEGAPVIIHGAGPASSAPCSACEASAMNSPIVPITHGGAPGYASVGSHAPGYGHVAGANDPAPIGVVRTNHSQANPGVPPHAAFPGAAAAMGGNLDYGAGAAPVAPWTGLPSSRRPSILGTMLGIRSPFSAIREAREARRIEAHAAIPMGAPAANGRVAELPASMVYGR